MAQEITISASLSGFKSGVTSSAVARAFGPALATMAGSAYTQDAILAGLSPTVVPLGQVTSPGWSFWLNLDATNYVTVRNGSGGADLIELLPGECAVLRLRRTAAPFVVADTAACRVEYLIFQL